jgi:hypothetical protein
MVPHADLEFSGIALKFTTGNLISKIGRIFKGYWLWGI